MTIDPAKWKPELRRLRLDEIQITHPSFFALSGGHDSKLVGGYTDKTSRGLSKAIMDWLKYHGHKKAVLNGRDVVKVADVHKFDIYSGKLRKVGTSVERTRIGPSNPLITVTIHGKRYEIEADAVEHEKPVVIPDGCQRFTVHNMTEFVTWLQSIETILA